MPEVVEIADVLEEMIRDRIASVSCSFPAKIQRVSPDGRSVDVVPLLRRPLQNEDDSWTSEELPTLSQIPLAQLILGQMRFTVPAAVEGLVTVLISDYDISTFLSTGDGGAANAFHSHDLSDAVAYPYSAQPAQAVSASELELGHASCLIQLNATRAAVGGETDAATADSLLQTELAKIQATLNSASAPSGGGPVTYGSPYIPGSTASTKLKIGG